MKLTQTALRSWPRTLCDELDGGYCVKACQIRDWLTKPFWTESAERVRVAVAANRRVCC